MFLRWHEEVPVHLRLPYISISYQQLQCRSQITQLPLFVAQLRSLTAILGSPSVTSRQTKLPAGSAGTEGCPLRKSCSHRDAGRSSSRLSAAKSGDKLATQPRSIDLDISRCTQPCGHTSCPTGSAIREETDNFGNFSGASEYASRCQHCTRHQRGNAYNRLCDVCQSMRNKQYTGKTTRIQRWSI